MGRFQSSSGDDSQSEKNFGTRVGANECSSFLTARSVDFFLDNLSATMFSHVVFRGEWVTCTVVPRKDDINRIALIRIEAVMSPATDIFNQPK